MVCGEGCIKKLLDLYKPEPEIYTSYTRVQGKEGDRGEGCIKIYWIYTGPNRKFIQASIK